MLFYSLFKTLVNKELTVELKNDIQIQGKLHSVDQYLNLKLVNISVKNEKKYPYLACLKNCFVRGSTIRYIQIPPHKVEASILHDATRREFGNGAK